MRNVLGSCGRLPLACAAALVIVSQLSVPASAQTPQMRCGPAEQLAAPPALPPPARPGQSRNAPLPGGASALQPACPQGLVPLLATPPQGGGRAMKGNPLLRPQSNAQPGGGSRALSIDELQSNRAQAQSSPTCDGIIHDGQPEYCYYYNTVFADGPTDGAAMVLTVNRPAYVALKGNGHTLAELAVQGGPNNGNVIEIGWRVSTDTYGDRDPHLFVFYWNGWDASCYDTCGWKQVSNTIFPGQNLSALVGQDIYVGWVMNKGNWWAFVNNEWIGYFPGSLWREPYEKSQLVQWYGEVATENGIPPRVEMGMGVFPTATDGGRMHEFCMFDVPTWACTTFEVKQFGVYPPTAAKYYGISRPSEADVRFGGPGK